MKILIVEDNDSKARVIATCIIQHVKDAEIQVASNAHDGYAFVLKDHIDLVFLDVLLPMKSGTAPTEEASVWFVREVQRKVSDSNLPLIVGTTQYLDSQAKVDYLFREYLWSIIFFSETDTRWRHQVGHAVRFARKTDLSVKLSRDDALPTDVAIVTALRVPEFEEVVNSIGGGDSYFVPESSENWIYRKLEILGGRQITVMGACADEMGMCSMSSLVTRVCIACRPKKLILCGIMGGNPSRAAMGDLVLVQDTWDYKAGKITEKGFEPDVKSRSCTRKLENAARTIVSDSELLKLWQAWKNTKPRQIPQLHFGSVACSSAVIADGKVFHELEAQRRKVFGVEMEAYGCYDAVHHLGSLAPSVICVKSICDVGDKEKGDIYQRYCAYLSANVVLSLIKDSRFIDA